MVARKTFGFISFPGERLGRERHREPRWSAGATKKNRHRKTLRFGFCLTKRLDTRKTYVICSCFICTIGMYAVGIASYHCQLGLRTQK